MSSVHVDGRGQMVSSMPNFKLKKEPLKYCKPLITLNNFHAP